MAPSPLFLLDWKKASKQCAETVLFLRVSLFFSSSCHATWLLVNKAGAGLRGSVGRKLVDITVREALVAVTWPMAYSVCSLGKAWARTWCFGPVYSLLSPMIVIPIQFLGHLISGSFLTK